MRVNELFYRILQSLILLILSAGLSSAFAQSSRGNSKIESIEINAPCPLFQKPSRQSPVLIQVPAGATLDLSIKEVRGWRRARFRARDRVVIGYVQDQDIQVDLDSAVVAMEEATKKKPSEMRVRKKSLGVAALWSGLRQGDRVFSLSDSVSRYQLSGLQSQMASLGLIGDFDLGERSGLQFQLSLRRQSFRGVSQLLGATSPSSARQILIRQDILSAGTLFRTKPFMRLPFWVGVGGEVGRGTRLSIELEGQGPLQTGPQDFPVQVQAILALGGDVQISSDWRLQTQLRALQILSATPQIQGWESVVGVLRFF